MKAEVQKLTGSQKKFLICILEHGNLNDSHISHITGLSNSTVSRVRKKLEKTLINEYIPIIELHKVGIKVFLVLTFQWTAFNHTLLTNKTFSALKSDPNVVFCAHGEGSASNSVLFMAFEDLEECSRYLKEFRTTHGKHVQQINTLLLPSKEIIKNDFTEVIKKMLQRPHDDK